MDNIYLQTEQDRNSIVQIPDKFAENAGVTLYSWLGSLWHGLHNGDDMVRGLQSARGIRLAQMYLDILEAVKLQDRNGAPVFHRELWHPIVVRLSRRNTAQENMLKIGMNGDIGSQPDGSIYGKGTIFHLGRLANFEDFVTYPVDADISGGAVSIVDNIINPTVRMELGKGDYYIRNNSIIFHKDNDPLGPYSRFDRYDVSGIVDDDGREVSDMEAVLWASDVLIDKNYISDHISYALGSDAPSSDVVKRILNAAWSSVTSGLTPSLTKILIAAMLNVPVIQHDRETVVDIYVETDTDGTPLSRVVKTDLGAYRVSLKAKLRKQVYKGSVLHGGDLLDESIRIYPFLNAMVDCIKCDGSESSGSDDSSSGSKEDVVLPDLGFSVPLEHDIPSVVLPPGILRAKTEYGIYAMWGLSRVKQADYGGADRLYFDVGGSEKDVRSFWEDIWSMSEDSGKSMKDFIGEKGDMISPAAFFIKHLIGANTLFVSIDRSQLDDTSMMRNPMFFDMLSDVVPSAIRLFLVEHRSVGDEDRMDMGTAPENTFLAAALGSEDEALPSGELVTMRFFRPPPAHVRGKREEEL